MDRRSLMQMAVSALVFYLVFRFLSFLGLGVVLVLAAVVGVWYLVARRPEALASWKTRAYARLPRRKQATQPAPRPDERTALSQHERNVFESMVRDFDKDMGDPNPRRSRG